MTESAALWDTGVIMQRHISHVPRLNGISIGKQNKKHFDIWSVFLLCSVHGAFATLFECDIFRSVAPYKCTLSTLYQPLTLRKLPNVVIEIQIEM